MSLIKLIYLKILVCTNLELERVLIIKYRIIANSWNF